MKKLCKIEGCESQEKARGWCSMHYDRWRNKSDMTRKLFDRDSIGYTYINIEDDADAYEYVTKTLGYRQAPAVVALFPGGSETHWSGFQPARIAGYIRAAKGWRDDS